MSRLATITIGLGVALVGCEPADDPFPNGPRVSGEHVIVGDEHSSGVVVLTLDQGDVVAIDRVGTASAPRIVKVPDESARAAAVILTASSLERLDLGADTIEVERLRTGSTLDSLAVSSDGRVALAASASRVVSAAFDRDQRAVRSVPTSGETGFRAAGFFPGSHVGVVTSSRGLLLVDVDRGTASQVVPRDVSMPDRVLPVDDGGLRRVIGLADDFFDDPSIMSIDPSGETRRYDTRDGLTELTQVGAHVAAWGESQRVYVMPIDGRQEPESYGFADEVTSVVALDARHLGIATARAVTRLDVTTQVQDTLTISGRVLSLDARAGRMVAAVEVGRDAELLVFMPGQPPRVVPVPGATTAAVMVPGARTIAAVRLVQGGRAVLWDEGALDAQPLVVPGFFLHQYLEREDVE